jgi:hypothetical protein
MMMMMGYLKRSFSDQYSGIVQGRHAVGYKDCVPAGSTIEVGWTESYHVTPTSWRLATRMPVYAVT